MKPKLKQGYKDAMKNPAVLKQLPNSGNYPTRHP